MKKVILLILTVILTTAFCNAQQDYKDFMKIHKAMAKFTKEQFNEKASKDARKEAKRLKKDGWEVASGSLPLEKQLDKSYSMQYEMDLDTGFSKFIKGEASSVGENYDAEKM